MDNEVKDELAGEMVKQGEGGTRNLLMLVGNRLLTQC